MKKSELRAKLEAAGVRNHVYTIDDDPLPATEGLILTGSEGVWYIEYSERGERRILERFQSEDAACDAMYEMLLADFLPKRRV